MPSPSATVTIERTATTLTTLGLGTAPLGGWPSAVTVEQGHATIAAAWDAGLRYFDTAPLYGYGQSERWLGEVLGDRPRDAFCLSTKIGKRLVPSNDDPVFFRGDHRMKAVDDYTADGAWRSIEESLHRLDLDRVDVAFIHDPDDVLDQALAGSYPALAEMRHQGIVHAVGVGSNSAAALTYLARRADLDCVLVAGRFTLLDQGALDELLPVSAERGISVIAGGVFNSGVLADPTSEATYDYSTASAATVERARKLREVCDRYSVPLKAAALQFPFLHPSVLAVVAGARTAQEVTESARLIQHPIPSALWTDMGELDLIRRDVPLLGT